MWGGVGWSGVEGGRWGGEEKCGVEWGGGWGGEEKCGVEGGEVPSHTSPP